MAEISPFRGIRFNDNRFPDLSPVIAPPYDVISIDDDRRLRERSESNAVRLILNEPRSGHAASNYSRIARLFNDWIEDETLLQDTAPAVYLLDQEFDQGGVRQTRRSVIVRLRIEPLGRGGVYAHEPSPPGAVADRLELLRATRMNMDQVLGLYRDDGSVAEILAEMSELDPVAEGAGIDGVRNVVRAVYYQPLIQRLAAALADKRLVIADGRDRYEAAVLYRDAMRPRHRLPRLNERCEFVSMALAASNDPGLVIGAMHRIVAGLKSFSPDALLAGAAAEFDVEEAALDAGAIVARLAQLADRHAFGLLTQAGARILVKKSGRREADGAPARLDPCILHQEIFAGLLGLADGAMPKGSSIQYNGSPADCAGRVTQGMAQLAVLLNPLRAEEIEAAALAGGTLPLRSANIVPRLPTGAVLNPVI